MLRFPCVSAVRAQTTSDPPGLTELQRIEALRQSLLPRVPIRSSDDAIRVFGARFETLDRMRLLRYAESCRTAFFLLTGIPDLPLAVDLFLTEEPRWPVRTGRMYLERGRLRARIQLDGSWAQSPGLLDMALCDAWLRLWIRSRNADAPDLPGWLSIGVARALNATQREADMEDVWQAWMSGRIPPFAALLADDGHALESFPAAAALAALWLIRDFGDKRPFAERLVHDGAGWTAGDPSAFSFADGVALDEAWDHWILRRASTILRPGTTTPGMVSRFRTQRLIFPGDSGIPFGDAVLGGMTPESLLAHRSENWASQAAMRKASELRHFVQGRGPELVRVAEAYASVLEAFATPVSSGTLRKRLRDADQSLDALAQRLLRGGLDVAVPAQPADDP